MAVPGPPGIFRILTYTNVRVDGDSNGGTGPGDSPINQYQVAWGTSPNVPGNGGGFGNLNISTGSGFITGLHPGWIYYFWCRLRNSSGYSAWSPRSQIQMRDVPDPPDYPTMVRRDQTSITVHISPNFNGGQPITQYKLWYGASPNVPGPGVKFSTGQDITLTGLIPGNIYYLWVQAQNVYGLSDLSPRSFISAIAGAFIQVGLVVHRAVPYVKIAGVWKVARPWGKIAGFWNETPE